MGFGIIIRLYLLLSIIGICASYKLMDPPVNATIQSVPDETEASIDFVENIQYDNNKVRVVYLRKFEEPSGPTVPPNSSLRVVNLKRAIPAPTTPADVEDTESAVPKREIIKNPLELKDIIPTAKTESPSKPPISKKPFAKITTSAEIKKQQRQLFEVYYDDYYDSEELNEYVADDGIKSDDIPSTEVCSTEECDSDEELIDNSDEFLPFGGGELITNVPDLLPPASSPSSSSPTDNQRKTKNTKISPFKVPPIKPNSDEQVPGQSSSSNETPTSTASWSTSSSSSSSSRKPTSAQSASTSSPARANVGDSRVIPFKAPPIKKQPITYFAQITSAPTSASTSTSSSSPSKSPNPADIKSASPKIIPFKAPPIKPKTSNQPSGTSTASPLAIVDTLDTVWNFISNIFSTNPNNTESGIITLKEKEGYNPILSLFTEAVTSDNVDTTTEVSPKDDIWDNEEEYPSDDYEEELTEDEIDAAFDCFNLLHYITALKAPDVPDFMKEPGFNPQQVEYMKFSFFRLIENFMFLFA